MPLCAWLLLGWLAFAAPELRAWGPQGHRLVADLAWTQMTPSARREALALLSIEGHVSLADISLWADEVRDLPEFRPTSPWHYVNFPRHDCSYRASRDCPGGDCVVAVIQTQALRLARDDLAASERLQALKWLVHMVGDVHQPLHAGFGDDLGGNRVQVQLAGRGSNLHALWDSGLLNARKMRPKQLFQELSREPLSVPPWQAEQAAEWAEEGCELMGAGLYPSRPYITRAYIAEMQPLLDRRLRLAAARLARLLNAQLGADAGPGRAP